MALINTRQEYARYGRYFQDLKEVYEKRPEVRASLELLLSLLTISFFIVFAIRPTALTISDLYSQIRSQKEIEETLSQKLSSLSRARQNYTKEQSRLPLIDDAFPKEPAPDSYLRQIEGLTVAHGVSLISYAVEQTLLYGKKPPSFVASEDLEVKKKESNPLKNVRTAFSVTGQYQNVLGFVDELESMRKIFKIDTMTIEPAASFGSQKDQGILVLKVTAYTPYYTGNAEKKN